MKNIGALVALLAGLVFLPIAFAGAPTLDRDAAIQARIAAVVTAVVEDPGASNARIESLRSEVDGRRHILILQLALFLSDSDSTEEGMVGTLLLRAFEFTMEEKLLAVLPHLDTEDPSLQKALVEIMATIDRAESAEPDFRFYEQRLRDSEPGLSGALIRYMYEVSPDAAFASMIRVFGDEHTRRPDSAGWDDLKALVGQHDGIRPWTDDDLSRGREILDRMSQDPSWWVRLYAAATLKKAPDLATPLLRARLADDRDPRVRSAL